MKMLENHRPRTVTNKGAQSPKPQARWVVEGNTCMAAPATQCTSQQVKTDTNPPAQQQYQQLQETIIQQEILAM